MLSAKELQIWLFGTVLNTEPEKYDFWAEYDVEHPPAISSDFWEDKP